MCIAPYDSCSHARPVHAARPPGARAARQPRQAARTPADRARPESPSAPRTRTRARADRLAPAPQRAPTGAHARALHRRSERDPLT